MIPILLFLAIILLLVISLTYYDVRIQKMKNAQIAHPYAKWQRVRPLFIFSQYGYGINSRKYVQYSANTDTPPVAAVVPKGQLISKKDNVFLAHRATYLHVSSVMLAPSISFTSVSHFINAYYQSILCLLYDALGGVELLLQKTIVRTATSAVRVGMTLFLSICLSVWNVISLYLAVQLYQTDALLISLVAISLTCFIVVCRYEYSFKKRFVALLLLPAFLPIAFTLVLVSPLLLLWRGSVKLFGRLKNARGYVSS